MNVLPACVQSGLSEPFRPRAVSRPAWILWLALVLGPFAAPGAEPPVNFRRDVLPILSDRCFQCHGPDEKARKANLRFDIREEVFQVRDGVSIVLPGRSDASSLYRRVTNPDPDEIMPPPETKRPLQPAQIATLKRWIDEGAKWGEHWAFEKLVSPPLPPEGRFAGRSVNPIDRFIFARLEKEGLAPSPAASRETLIRRVSLDLTGLPPGLEEVEAFARDGGGDGYERVVDRLLNSPAFGERMAWDWLDAARYADSNGYQGDSERTMWPWRDWVVSAFNGNLSYDKFTVWQLAGDLLPEAGMEEKLATGFCRNHMINGEGGRIPEENRVDYVMDIMETAGTVWLGLTMNCCRCHDHKFDPLTQGDYYSLTAFFNRTPVTGEGGDPQGKPNLEVPSMEQRIALARTSREVEEAQAKIEEIELKLFPRAPDQSGADSSAAAGLPDAARNILKVAPGGRTRTQLAELEKQFTIGPPEYLESLKQARERMERSYQAKGSIPKVMIMEEMAVPRKTFMLERGLYNKPGAEVEPRPPSSLPALATDAPRNRLGLARWLVSTENPLTARVTVNRVWQQFFGVGLVKTPEDFGVQGEFPKHPELLDWLASELIRSGWDLKHLVRLMVTSAVYRQSSRVTPELLESDPENRLLARAPRYRLPSWMIRDQALEVGGLLVRAVGGAPVRPYQPPGIWEEATFGNKRYQQDHGEKLYRRSLYTFWRRIVGPTMFFDSASRQVCSVKQPRTNSPLHALATLNDVTYLEAARGLAGRVLGSNARSDAARIELAFRLVLARNPSGPELAVFRSSLDRLRGQWAADPAGAEKFLEMGELKVRSGEDRGELAAWAVLSLGLLNLDEALTRE